jgi:uncharacterized protein (DUF362 family)
MIGMIKQVDKETRGHVFCVSYKNWSESVPKILVAAKLSERIPENKTVLVKPNLVEPLPPPVTTPVEMVAAIVDHLHEKRPDLKIVVGEGTGAMRHDTWHVFKELGYTGMASAKGIELIDLNQLPLVMKSRTDCRRWPEMHLPPFVYETYLLSVPVLKVHTLAGVTLTMKNMMGLAPPSYYQQGGHWKKSAFHTQIQAAIADLNRYRTPDFTLLDATQGMCESHLWGPTCNPPPNKLIAGFDPVAVDSFGTGLLGKKWQDIGHIQMAHEKLGIAEPLKVIQVEE